MHRFTSRHVTVIIIDNNNWQRCCHFFSLTMSYVRRFKAQPRIMWLLDWFWDAMAYLGKNVV